MVTTFFKRSGSCRIQFFVNSVSEMIFLKLYLLKVVQSFISSVVLAVSRSGDSVKLIVTFIVEPLEVDKVYIVT